MSDNHPRSDSEERLLRRLRVTAVVVILCCIVLVVAADNIGRLFIDRDFHASDIFLFTLVGALGALLGTELLARVPKKGGPPND